MANLFSYSVKNEFIQDKETVIELHFCGRQIGEVYFSLDNVYVSFTKKEPGVAPHEWRMMETILNKIKSQKSRFVKD